MTHNFVHDYGNQTPTTLADVKAWREGWWYLVEVHGWIAYRRHTRDESFTHARLLFPGTGSTSELKERKWGQCYGVELMADWQKRGWIPRWSSYDLTVPILPSRDYVEPPPRALSFADKALPEHDPDKEPF